MKSTTQRISLYLVFLLARHGPCNGINIEASLRGGRRTTTTVSCGGITCPSNHICVGSGASAECEDLCAGCANSKICVVTGFSPPNEVECECPPEHFENSIGNCLSEAEWFADDQPTPAPATPSTPSPVAGALALSSVVSTTPKLAPSIMIYFQNDHAGAETNLTLLYKGIELWSDGCSGTMCEITDSIEGVELECDGASLVVETANNAPFLSSPSMFYVTVNGLAVVNETTVFTGITTRERKTVDTGTFNFECDGASGMKPGDGLQMITKPPPSSITEAPPTDTPSLEVYFRNDENGHDATLTLLQDGIEVWTNSCKEAGCEIDGSIPIDDASSCQDLSLWLNSSSTSNFLPPSALRASFNGITVVAEKAASGFTKESASLATGVYTFTCSDPTKPPPPSEKQQTAIAIYFQNDDIGEQATLSVLHNGVQIWSESCSGSECEIIADDILSDDDTLVCQDLSLQLNNANSDIAFSSPSILNITYNGLVVVDETTIVGDGVATTKDLKRIYTGRYPFDCGTPAHPQFVHPTGDNSETDDVEEKETTSAPTTPPPVATKSPITTSDETKVSTAPTTPPPVTTKSPTTTSDEVSTPLPTSVPATPLSAEPSSSATLSLSSIATIFAVGICSYMQL